MVSQGFAAIILAAAIALIQPQAALAEGRQALGWGGMLTNDLFYQGRDRWRTGGVTLSYVTGPDWQGALPDAAGQILEYRFYGGALAPASLQVFNPADRRYAGVLSLGLHSHFQSHGADISLGVDAVAVGPQTGISDFHTWLHKAIGMDAPTIMGTQLGNAVYLTPNAEIGRSFALGSAQVRPFVQAQAGAETLLRVGADVTLGTLGRGGLMLRDGDSGQRYSAIDGDGTGTSLVLGGDIARVFDSAFMPAGGAVTASTERHRLRMGVDQRSAHLSAFYGLTWLGPEFDEQAEGQVIGAVNFGLNF